MANDESLAIPGTLIVGGLGLFIGSYYVKSPGVAGAMKIGGVLATIAGVVTGGEALLKKVGLGTLLGGDKKPEKVSTDTETVEEQISAFGGVSGRIIAPVEGAHLDPGSLETGYDVSVRVFNDSNYAARVRVSLAGHETYAISSDEQIGADLGEWAISPKSSINVAGRVGLGSYAHLPFASPDVELSLLLNSNPVHTIHFSYD